MSISHDITETSMKETIHTNINKGLAEPEFLFIRNNFFDMTNSVIFLLLPIAAGSN